MPNANYIVLSLFLAAFLMSVVLHEVAHGWVAKQCGDPTAELAGRLSLNPIRHIDPVMTIIVPFFMMYFAGVIFGGAKPVPVNPYNFRNLERDDLKVSVAGVVVNFIIAAVFGFGLHLWQPGQMGFTLFALVAVANLVLAFFNLIPIPPLDGSHVMRFIIARFSPQAAARYERLGMFGLILVFLLFGFFSPLLFGAVDFVWTDIFMIRDVSWMAVIHQFRQSFAA